MHRIDVPAGGMPSEDPVASRVSGGLIVARVSQELTCQFQKATALISQAVFTTIHWCQCSEPTVPVS